MNKKDYEKYYQTGGSYIIPIEIFNEIFDEYECFKNDCQKYKKIIDKAIKHVNKYESIKAFYEYIDEDGYDEYNDDEDFKKELLVILKEVE